MKNGIAVCGNIFIDHVKMVDTFPEEGMLANIRGQDCCVGGCVSNTIINLSRLETEAPLYAVGCVGKDQDGSYLISVLRKYGVNTDYIFVREDQATGFTDAIVSQKKHTRTFFNLQGANADFGVKDIPTFSINVKIAHLGYALLLDAMDREEPEYGTVMAHVLHDLQARGIKTSIDVVSEAGARFQKVVIPSLKYCSYLIVNEIEAGMIAGIPAREQDGTLREQVIPKICRELLSYGVGECVVIHCPEAGYYMSRSGSFYMQKSLSLPEGFIVNSVGAGDAFCAGALYGLYHELSPQEVLKIGNGAAAASLSGDNSINGLTGLEQIVQLEQKYGQ
ncbi:carbohydrate kinase family protein [Massiliimalia timonensis]|uniref:carbohydrate kinase family protein n=1 Tax=Massiliimalia timonensis TaxID=1987501 RepID=UPI000B8B2C9B|nr:carbohydrate kinase family protein [Massiliimalia timonensis]